jgi:hypothetical protein
MKVIRSETVELQVRDAMAVRDRMLNALKLRGLVDPLVPGDDKQEPVRNPFLQTLCSAAEGFIPVVTATPIDQVDRKKSMLAGPFFTSQEYPIPTTSSGCMTPIIQLDLKALSEISRKNFGDGLLQFWCDTDWDNEFRDFIRVVPREVLNNAAMTAFESLDVDAGPVPEEWIFDNSCDEIEVISGFESMGMHAQTSYLDVYAGDLTEDQLSLISDDLAEFMKLTDLDNKLHLFGSFYPIQYSSVDVGVDWNCLMHFPQWGSSGNAQVFYCLDKNGDMSFTFQESLR